MLKAITVVLLCAASSLLTASAQTLPQMRMTPAEITVGPAGNSQIGSSKLAGVHTKVLFGDPTKAGFYSILLFVPAHVTIQAHTHRDNRMATVVSGEWHFGYGDHFAAEKLKTLPSGSVYTEPGHVVHFARTTDSAVVVQISGYGPTDTKYFDPANDPEATKP
jgi:uncharacterized RmlC-like cupin family protein